MRDTPCPGCGSTHPYLCERGCVELARIQREQLAAWRAQGGSPDPGRWAAREAEIERILAPKLCESDD